MAGAGAWVREARRRRLFRAGALYVVGAWVLLQVVDLALESFGFPDTAMRYLWYAAVAGFPLALVFGWRYDLTAEGIRRTPAGGTADLTLKPLDYGVLVALVAVMLAIGWRAIDMVRQSELEGPPVMAEAIDPNSLAVLPLENLSGDDEQAYLSAGIHDALITSLSKLRALRVTSRTSAVRVDGTLAIPEIGRRLGVAKVIEGSVTREGDRVRVIVQLIDAETDTHIWAESFERRFEGVLAMQHEIARSIASAVEIRLSPSEERALPTEIDVRPDTWEAWLRGMYLMHRERLPAYRRGIAILKEAVANDPTSALAHAGLAYAYTKLAHSPLMPDRDAYYGARDAALEAIALDDSMAEAHLALGMFRLYYEWDWIGAEESLTRATEINPSLVEAHYHLAWMMELFLDHDRALYHGELTTRLDPLSPFMSGWLAEQYRAAGLFDRAIAEAEATLELSPDYPVGWLVLGKVYSELGRHEEAIASHQRLRGSTFWSFALAQTLAWAGRPGEAREILAGLPETPAWATPRVLVLAALHDDEAVFTWLETAHEVRSAWYPWLINWFRATRYLRDHPRLRALAEELGLPMDEPGDALDRRKADARGPAGQRRCVTTIAPAAPGCRRAVFSSAAPGRLH